MTPYVHANQAKAFDDSAFVASWYELQRRLYSAIGKAVTVAGVCFVGPDGDDATAQPDRLDLKYKTVQAAVNVALGGVLRIVCLCPGVYPESVQLPASFSNLYMISLFPSAARILPAVQDAPALRYSPAAGGSFDGIFLLDLVLGGNIDAPGLATVLIDCSAISSNGQASLYNCDVFNLDVPAPLRCVRARALNAERCNIRSNNALGFSIDLEQCASGELISCELGGTYRDSFDSSLPVPPSPRTPVSFQQCLLTSLVVLAEARVSLEYCNVRFPAVGTLNDTNGQHGSMDFAWCSLAGVSFVCTFAGETTCSISHHNKHNGGLSVVQNVGGVTAKVQFRHDDFQNSGNVTSGADCLIDILGSTFVQTNLLGAGAIDRDWHVFSSVVLPVGPVGAPLLSPLLSITPPFGNVPYDVIWNGLANAGPAGTVVEYIAKSAVGFQTLGVSPSAVGPTTHAGDLRAVARS